MDELAYRRPIERRVARLAANGMVPDEIGRRFRRSGPFIERVLGFADLPGRAEPAPTLGLRPIERRLLRWRAEGASTDELADRFRRGPGYIERVLAFADMKQSRHGSSDR